MGRKKKAKSARQQSEPAAPPAGETTVGVVGDVNAPVRNLFVKSQVHYAPTKVIINVHQPQGSPQEIDKRLVHQIKEIIASERGTKGFHIPIEKITDIFQKKHNETFKSASGGKKLIKYIRDCPQEFHVEEHRGNLRVSLQKDFVPEDANQHSSRATATRGPLVGACALPVEEATTADVSRPTVSEEVRTASPCAPVGTAEEQERIFKAFVEGGQVEERPAPLLHAADKSKAKVPVVYDIEESPGERAQDQDDPSTDETERKMSPVERIFKKAHGFKQGLFALITGPLPEYITKLEGLSNIPWQVVFDFNELSRDDGGLLATVEDFVQRKRPLHICDWSESSIQIRHNATIWCFAKGRRDKPESRIKEYKEWRSKCYRKLETVLNDLASFVHGCSVLTVLVFWNDDIGEYLNYFICRLFEKLEKIVQIILCIDKDTVCGESVHLRHLELETEVEKDNVSFEHLIQAFTKVESNPAPTLHPEFKLPTADGTNVPGIDEELAAQLAEDLDVLYLRNPNVPEVTFEVMQKTACKFFRGETLSWANRYSFDAEPLDVKRDVHENIVKTLLDHLSDQDSFKTATFTLLHTPGSGGTTTAQRVLWELKDHFPCVQVHFGRGPIRDISSKIDKIYRLTHKPVVCLIDGEDDLRIRQIKRQLKDGTFIIFAVQRCRKIPLGENNPRLSRRFWLGGQVSRREAPLMTMKFSNYCDASQKNALRKLCREVEQGKKSRHLFEFGLTAFLHEFRGIQSLVRGYLQLEDNHDNKLKRHQKILAYLSLVYFYGQTSVPCQFFCDLLNYDRREFLGLDDFPVEVQQLSVEDDEYGHNIRICHNLVAQEILEQVLTHGNAPPDRQDALSQSARAQLHLFTMEFIDYASNQIQGISSGSSPIAWILTRTIIFRDFKDTGKSESASKSRKPDLSRLLTDIHSYPPYEERLQVLQHLTVKFPKEQNFFAHLGRFYSKHRPNEEEESERAFETALALCIEKAGGEGTNPNDMDESLRVSLMHIYHMYGMVYSRRVGRFTGRYFGDKPEVDTNAAQFGDRVSEVLQMAQRAIELFQLDRYYTPPGQEESYGYYGEIMVRLQVCDYIHRKNPQVYSLGEYATAEKADPQVSQFVKESIMVIDELFFECYSVVNDDGLDNDLRGLLTWHNALLGREAKLEKVYAKLDLEDDIRTRRLRVATKKLLYSRARNLSVIENITSKEDINEIVQCYEANFDDVHTKGLETSKRLLDIDYREWLVAIRHPLFSKLYTLPEVLRYVVRWHEYLHSIQSLFYLFILNSLIGFGDNMRRGSSQNLAIAQTLLRDLKKYNRHVLKPQFPREWLGKTGKGIKRLVLGFRLLRHIEGSNIRPNAKSKDSVAVCKGTICKPNRSTMGGYISLDLGHDNYIQVEVFYIPVKAALVGEFYADRRVEFHLGFSIDHGYEAFNVALLLKTSCGHCGHTAEVRSGEMVVCSKCNHKIIVEEPVDPDAHTEHPGSSGAEASEN